MKPAGAMESLVIFFCKIIQFCLAPPSSIAKNCNCKLVAGFTFFSCLFIFVLTQKRTKKVKPWIFAGQIGFWILKEMNSLRSNSISFYGFFKHLTLASKSYGGFFNCNFKDWLSKFFYPLMLHQPTLKIKCFMTKKIIGRFFFNLFLNYILNLNLNPIPNPFRRKGSLI